MSNGGGFSNHVGRGNHQAMPHGGAGGGPGSVYHNQSGYAGFGGASGGAPPMNPMGQQVRKIKILLDRCISRDKRRVPSLILD